MVLLAMAVAQAVSASPPEQIDLTIAQPCQPRSSEPDEVVVCAPGGPSPYRIQEPASPPRKEIPPAKVKIADGVEAGVETESADVGGFASKRALLRFKVKF